MYSQSDSWLCLKMGQPLRNCNFNLEDDDEHMDSWDTLFSHKPMCKADDKKYLWPKTPLNGSLEKYRTCFLCLAAQYSCGRSLRIIEFAPTK